MKKLLIATLALLCFLMLDSERATAQQDAEYTQYMFNSLVLNPAYAGSRDALSATAIYRHQWAGMDGAPRTLSLGGHSPIGDRVGVGLFLENDRIGVHNRFSLFGSYAYKIPVAADGNLSLGLQAGILSYASNWANLPNIQDPTDPNFQGQQSKLLPNFGIGAYYYTDRYYVGLSVPHLLANNLDDISPQAKQYMHYFLTGGMVFDINSDLKLKPSILIKHVPSLSPLEADLNVSLLFRDALWVGMGYRTADALLFLLEYQFPTGLRIGYSYDLTLTKLSGFNSGSHEIMLGIDLDTGSGGNSIQKVLSPRYF